MVRKTWPVPYLKMVAALGIGTGLSWRSKKVRHMGLHVALAGQTIPEVEVLVAVGPTEVVTVDDVEVDAVGATELVEVVDFETVGRGVVEMVVVGWPLPP
jgi:hypothetical protein